MTMTHHILLINPNTSEATTHAMHALALPCLPAQVQLHSVTAAQGVPMITTAQELDTATAQVLALAQQWAPRVDAVVVGAFGNPGVAQLRGVLSIPVLGIGEASMREAAAGGRRFGVATTTPQLRASIDASVQALGLGGHFTGCQIPSCDAPLALAQQPHLQDAQLALAVRACIEQDGAQAVVIGGGPLAEAVPRLAPLFAVPVISPVEAAMRGALQLLGLAKVGCVVPAIVSSGKAGA